MEVTPVPLRSRASDTARLCRAARVALYCGWVFIGWEARPPPIVMTRPQPRSRIAGTRCWIIRTPETISSRTNATAPTWRR